LDLIYNTVAPGIQIQVNLFASDSGKDNEDNNVTKLVAPIFFLVVFGVCRCRFHFFFFMHNIKYVDKLSDPSLQRKILLCIVGIQGGSLLWKEGRIF